MRLNNNPTRKQPIRLTARVPNGNVSPYLRATTPDSQYRHIVPMIPANPTESNLIMHAPPNKTPDRFEHEKCRNDQESSTSGWLYGELHRLKHSNRFSVCGR